METRFTKQVGIRYPIVCGAMYPCSNPELVAAASAAGGIGIIQPLSMVYVHGHDFRKGMQLIRTLTKNPVGVNVIVEKSSKTYEVRMRAWVEIALEFNVKFFVTALGNPRWVIDLVRPHGGIVYHDVTEKKWAEKALHHGVDGLICVNNRAGGHAGRLPPDQLLKDLQSFNVPLICAGGIGDKAHYQAALSLGYDGVQMGTRFIASSECRAHEDYKTAILKAEANDIVLTDKISGVPVSVIKTPFVERTGTRAGPISRFLLRQHKTKHWMRFFYTVRSLWSLKKASLQGSSYKDYFQAGKSVDGIESVEPVEKIVSRFVA